MLYKVIAVLLGVGILSGCGPKNVTVSQSVPLDVRQTYFYHSGRDYQYCVKCFGQIAKSKPKHPSQG